MEDQSEKPWALRMKWWLWFGMGTLGALSEFSAGSYGGGYIFSAAAIFGLYLLWARIRENNSGAGQ